MSILGYSAAYFLPEYWSNTPFYGEKLIPLLDYVLSTDFDQSEKLADAFYMMENKYKNTADLPIEAIKDIIQESGYGYVLDLLGQDEESIRLLVYLLVLIHQLKGTQLGIEVVLNLLKKSTNPLVRNLIGNVKVDDNGEAHDFSNENYILYTNFTTDSDPFELNFQIRTPSNFSTEQAIASASEYGFYLGITTTGRLVLCLGSDRSTWNIVNRVSSNFALNPSTNYFIKLVFDGYNYTVKVAEIFDTTNVVEGNLKFNEYIVVDSNIPLGAHSRVVYIGVDGSTGVVSKPFQGYINLKPFSIDVSNVRITEWFEQFPVGEENTFFVDVDLDLGVVSTDFFEKFAVFVSKYVYPTLAAMEVKLNFKNNLTFIPYVRQKITYVANGDVMERVPFLVKEATSSPVATLPMTVLSPYGYRLDFEVVAEDD